MNVSDIFRYFSPDPARRRRARFRIMKGYAKRNDFEIYKDHMLWSKDSGFREVRRAYPLPGIPEDRCFVLYSVAKSIIDVPGDLAECGVRFGKSAAIVRWVTKDTGKTLHLFDSFEGISEPDPEDVPSAGPTKDWKRGMLAVDEATVRANLVGLQQIDFHRGWVPQRFSDVADATFSLVHLDLDLFQPTRDSFAFFYPRVSPGGVIVCDDYGSSYCPGAMKACDEFMRDKPEKVLHLPTGQALISKH